MIRWVFLDVGNVLLDEDPLTFLSFLRHAEAVNRARPELTFHDVLAARETCAAAGSRWPVYEAVIPILGEIGCASVWTETAAEVRARFAELSPPITGAADFLNQLIRLGLRLGLIANQGPEVRDHLAALGMLDAFEIVAFSEEIGHFKPDLALFHHALNLAGAEPAHCLMIGDRLDNDVAPATLLGMATAWVRWPDRAAKGWNPTDSRALAYLASLQRLAPQIPPADLVPTLVVDDLSNLANAIGRMID